MRQWLDQTFSSNVEGGYGGEHGEHLVDIGNRTAPTADDATRSAGPSRICIGLDLPPPDAHAGVYRPQHEIAMGPAADISGRLHHSLGGPGFWKVLEPAAGGSCWGRGGGARGRLVRYERFRWFFACSDLEFGWRTL